MIGHENRSRFFLCVVASVLALWGAMVLLEQVFGRWTVYNAAYAALLTGGGGLVTILGWMWMRSGALILLGGAMTVFGLSAIQGFWLTDRLLSIALGFVSEIDNTGQRVLSGSDWFYLLHLFSAIAMVGIAIKCRALVNMGADFSKNWIFLSPVAVMAMAFVLGLL